VLPNLALVNTAAFGAAQLTTLGAGSKPSGDWQPWPPDTTPYWWLAKDGRAVLAWPAANVLRDLFLFEQETRTAQRDRHGRFASADSPYIVAGLGHVPWLNELAFAVTALVFRDRIASSGWDALKPLQREPVVCLSHDCDVLDGGDMWTQSARLYRFAAPM